MCRNIKQLRRTEGPPTKAECEAAALQYVRKVTGYRQPSAANADAFATAVAEITAITQTLVDNLIIR